MAGKLTWGGADVVVVEAAAAAGGAALVTPAAGRLAVVRLVASVPAGRVGNIWRRETDVPYQLLCF